MKSTKILPQEIIVESFSMCIHVLKILNSFIKAYFICSKIHPF